MQKIGTIAFVQIQRYSMKQAVADDVIYETTPLQRVDRLWLTGDGIMGIADQTVLVDVHNRLHPESKYRGDNRISIGFLSNYEAMRGRFGAHMTDGIAGENILITLDATLPLDVLNRQWLLVNRAGREIPLQAVIPAPPCREFSIFCAQQTIAGAELKATLQFLSDGTRGYYAELAQPQGATVQAGDALYIR